MLDGAMEGLEKRGTAPMAHRGMVVCVTSWVLTVVMLITFFTRLSMKFTVIKKGRKFGVDDLFIVLAALFSVGQTAAVSMESIHALGQHRWDITLQQFRIFQKAEYAGCMLYIANMGCSRISVCFLIKKVLPGKRVKYTCFGFAILSIVWTLADVLVTLFPCKFPDQWRFLEKECIDIFVFIQHVAATNICIEVIIIVMPLLVWNLRISAGRSISVSAVFMSRLLVITAISCELFYFRRTGRSPDVTYDFWSTVMCRQVAQNISIITACLPCFHPFMLDILSGRVKAEKLRYDYKESLQKKGFFTRRRRNFDATASSSSTRPMNESKMEHCRPLATHGLLRSSTQLDFQTPSNIASDSESPMEEPKVPENVFMRHIEISEQNPQTYLSARPLGPAPKSLNQVGIIPSADWDTESSDRCPSSRSDRSRRRNSDYIFNRQKVISVPENNAMYEQDQWRRYPPPPKSGEK